MLELDAGEEVLLQEYNTAEKMVEAGSGRTERFGHLAYVQNVLW